MVRDVDRFIAEQAREFIWKRNLQPYDAIHLATAYRMKLLHLDTYDRADLGKLSGKSGSFAMKISEPPLIPYQTEIPKIEPGQQTTSKSKEVPPGKVAPNRIMANSLLMTAKNIDPKEPE
jgi:ParB-like chromosome segregation protein Spo0J